MAHQNNNHQGFLCSTFFKYLGLALTLSLLAFAPSSWGAEAVKNKILQDHQDDITSWFPKIRKLWKNYDKGVMSLVQRELHLVLGSFKMEEKSDQNNGEVIRIVADELENDLTKLKEQYESFKQDEKVQLVYLSKKIYFNKYVKSLDAKSDYIYTLTKEETEAMLASMETLLKQQQDTYQAILKAYIDQIRDYKAYNYTKELLNWIKPTSQTVKYAKEQYNKLKDGKAKNSLKTFAVKLINAHPNRNQLYKFAIDLPRAGMLKFLLTIESPPKKVSIALLNYFIDKKIIIGKEGWNEVETLLVNAFDIKQHKKEPLEELLKKAIDKNNAGIIEKLVTKNDMKVSKELFDYAITHLTDKQETILTLLARRFDGNGLKGIIDLKDHPLVKIINKGYVSVVDIFVLRFNMEDTIKRINQAITDESNTLLNQKNIKEEILTKLGVPKKENTAPIQSSSQHEEIAEDDASKAETLEASQKNDMPEDETSINNDETNVDDPNRHMNISMTRSLSVDFTKDGNWDMYIENNNPSKNANHKGQVHKGIEAEFDAPKAKSPEVVSNTNNSVGATSKSNTDNKPPKNANDKGKVTTLKVLRAQVKEVIQAEDDEDKQEALDALETLMDSYTYKKLEGKKSHENLLLEIIRNNDIEFWIQKSLLEILTRKITPHMHTFIVTINRNALHWIPILFKAYQAAYRKENLNPSLFRVIDMKLNSKKLNPKYKKDLKQYYHHLKKINTKLKKNRNDDFLSYKAEEKKAQIKELKKKIKKAQKAKARFIKINARFLDTYTQYDLKKADAYLLDFALQVGKPEQIKKIEKIYQGPIFRRYVDYLLKNKKNFKKVLFDDHGKSSSLTPTLALLQAVIEKSATYDPYAQRDDLKHILDAFRKKKLKLQDLNVVKCLLGTRDVDLIEKTLPLFHTIYREDFESLLFFIADAPPAAFKYRKALEKMQPEADTKEAMTMFMEMTNFLPNIQTLKKAFQKELIPLVSLILTREPALLNDPEMPYLLKSHCRNLKKKGEVPTLESHIFDHHPAMKKVLDKTKQGPWHYYKWSLLQGFFAILLCASVLELLFSYFAKGAQKKKRNIHEKTKEAPQETLRPKDIPTLNPQKRLEEKRLTAKPSKQLEF